MASADLMIDQRCWTRIGVWGDGSCVELARVNHCRNCDVYGSSGRRLFDRPAPLDYIVESTAQLAEDHIAEAVATTPYLVFRVGQTWFAVLATRLREITDPTVIRSVPHRARDIFRGLVNVRGELRPCVSLHAVLGEEASAARVQRGRFLVARWENAEWVFPVDEVDGMKYVAENEIEPLPTTLASAPVVYTKGLFTSQGTADRNSSEKKVAIIDESMLFGALLRRIA